MKNCINITIILRFILIHVWYGFWALRQIYSGGGFSKPYKMMDPRFVLQGWNKRSFQIKKKTIPAFSACCIKMLFLYPFDFYN